MERFRECCFKTIPEHGRRLVWEITHICGVGCEYCFQEKKRKTNLMRGLSDTDLIDMCSKLESLKVSDVLITGGEIFHVRKTIGTICNELKKRNIPISFSTIYFGRLDFIEYLLSFKPRAINVSFDPRSNESETSYIGIFSKLEKFLSISSDHDTNIKITGVVNKNNIGNFSSYIRRVRQLCKKYDSLSSVYVTNPYEIGFEKSGVRANQSDLSNITKLVRDARVSKKVKLVNFPRFNKPLQLCNAGSRYMHMEPNGNIYPCHLFANLNQEYYLMGNIFTTPVKEIDERLGSFGQQAIGAIEEYKKDNKKCQVCTVERDCGAGCLAEVISIGNLIEPQLVCKDIAPPRPKKRYSTSSQIGILFKENDNDITRDVEEEIINYIKNNIKRGDHDLAHGFDHVECVVRLARYIAKRENGNLRIATVAAYFHDFEPRRKLIFQSHTTLSAQKAVDFLESKGFSKTELDEIYLCIDSSSYGAGDVGHNPRSIEAKIVRDADWLDAIGARGIARVFAFGAAHKCETLGECDWDPRNPPRKKMSLVGPDPSPVYHFFSKLLWVKDQVVTETGKKIAEKRHERLVRFLEDYKSEMSDEWLL